MASKNLRVAMIAPPWLSFPIKGYGGIELVLQSLVEELLRSGVEVTLFANTARKMKSVRTEGYYTSELFDYIDYPYYDAPLQIMQTHLHYALDHIRKDGGYDIIHDHNPYIGPSFFSLASQISGVPPVLHTFHGPPFSTQAGFTNDQIDNRPQLEFIDISRLFMVCISQAMTQQAPAQVQPHLLDAVYNAIDVNSFPFVDSKKNYYITLARFTRDKGQEIAVRYATRHKKYLRMAGTVAGIGTSRRLLLELSNPLSPYRKNEEFRYYSDKILPAVLRYPRITYAGNLSGKKKMKFIANAKALLFPIQWEEPFGMAVIEALACGTPVIAMRRGAMPELIAHGVNGFLADTEEEFYEYADRAGEIDPVKCRESVEKQFSAKLMAQEYIKRYKEVIEHTS